MKSFVLVEHKFQENEFSRQTIESIMTNLLTPAAPVRVRQCKLLVLYQIIIVVCALGSSSAKVINA